MYKSCETPKRAHLSDTIAAILHLAEALRVLPLGLEETARAEEEVAVVAEPAGAAVKEVSAICASTTFLYFLLQL